MKKAEEIFRFSNFRKAYLYLKKNGFSAAAYAVAERLHRNDNENYQAEELSGEERRKQSETGFEYQPKISILVPAFETREAYLREMIESVLSQTYSKLELIIADASGTDIVEKTVRDYQKQDGRIVYMHLKQNKGISDNSNAALDAADGDYIGLLDHDDVITGNALFEMVKAINLGRERKISLKMLYSDEDKGDSGLLTFYEPHKKEKFNLDLLLSNNYICHFLLMESELMKNLRFRGKYDGAQDYDLVLRAAGRLKPEEVCHIPKILYHWRCHGDSTAENPASKMYAYEAGKRALEDFAEKQDWTAEVNHTEHLGFYEVRYYIPDSKGESTMAEAVFANRKDIGAVGGRLLRKGRIAGGAYREDGAVMYEGLYKHFSGYMHRAVLCQDVEAADIRCMEVRAQFKEELADLLESIQKADGVSDEQYVQASIELCKRIRKEGYRILWNPGMEKSV